MAHLIKNRIPSPEQTMTDTVQYGITRSTFAKILTEDAPELACPWGWCMGCLSPLTRARVNITWTHFINDFYCACHGPLTRYIKLRVAHAPGMPGTFPPPPTEKETTSDPGMHHGTCVTHVPWCMSGSLARSGGVNVPGIPDACATRNFTYLARGPWQHSYRDVCKIF